jgi:hypothetical protein
MQSTRGGVKATTTNLPSLSASALQLATHAEVGALQAASCGV